MHAQCVARHPYAADVNRVHHTHAPFSGEPVWCCALGWCFVPSTFIRANALQYLSQYLRLSNTAANGQTIPLVSRLNESPWLVIQPCGGICVLAVFYLYRVVVYCEFVM